MYIQTKRCSTELKEGVSAKGYSALKFVRNLGDKHEKNHEYSNTANQRISS